MEDTEEPVNWDNVELNIETEPFPETESEPYFPESSLIRSSDQWDQFRKETGPDLFLCFLCEEEFVEKQSLISHINSEHENNTLCFICKSAFTSVSVLLVHIDLIHLGKSPSETKWKCLECHSSTGSGHNISFHVWTTTSPFMYQRHKILEHPEGKDLTNDTTAELPRQCQYGSVYVCHFCKSGFYFRENLYLHLVHKHRIEWDIGFNVAANFGMLHQKKVLRCLKCPKTFSTEALSDDHSDLACKYFLENYNLLTGWCSRCPRNKTNERKTGLTGENYHGYCVTAECHLHSTRKAKTFNIAYNHVTKYKPVKYDKCNCCRYHGLNLFTCPLCYGEFPSFITLTGHYFRKHHQDYGDIVSKLEPGNCQDFSKIMRSGSGTQTVIDLG